MQEKHHLEPNLVLVTVEGLYEEYPGEYLRAACKEEIEAKNEIGSLVYGEVGFVALSWMLNLAMKNCTSKGSNGPEVFYDLGSGSGRMVVTSALLHPALRRLVGIEIIGSLHRVAIEVKGKMEQEVQGCACNDAARRIHFSHGDILKVNWQDADIVLVNSTCFTQELMENLEDRASKLLQPGAVIITLTSSFHGASWELVSKARRQMSWGPADIYVQRRLPVTSSSDTV